MVDIQALLLKASAILYGILFAIGRWYFSSIDKKITKNTEDIEKLKTKLELNTQSDEIVRKQLEDIQKSSSATQTMITDFLTKYSFVLDKLVEQEKKK